MQHSEQIDQIAAALAEVQSKIQPAPRDAKNPHLQNRYATLNSVWDAVREVLPASGLSVAQGMEPGRAPEMVILTTMLLHKSGQWLLSRLEMAPGARDKGPQGTGSLITYARRYALAAMIGVVTDLDDDGEAAQRPKAQETARKQRATNPAPSLAAEDIEAMIKKADTLDGLAAIGRQHINPYPDGEQKEGLKGAWFEQRVEILLMQCEQAQEIAQVEALRKPASSMPDGPHKDRLLQAIDDRVAELDAELPV